MSSISANPLIDELPASAQSVRDLLTREFFIKAFDGQHDGSEPIALKCGPLASGLCETRSIKIILVIHVHALQLALFWAKARKPPQFAARDCA